MWYDSYDSSDNINKEAEYRSDELPALVRVNSVIATRIQNTPSPFVLTAPDRIVA
jgi:hypothetical protein